MKMTDTIKNYLQSTYGEVRKVVWPSRQKTYNDTIIVIVSVIVATIVFGLLDLGLSSILTFLIERR